MQFRMYHLKGDIHPENFQIKGRKAHRTTNRPSTVTAYIKRYNHEHWHTPSILILADLGYGGPRIGIPARNGSTTTLRLC